MTVEVFKTDVESKEEAIRLLGCIHNIFPSYRATFDLEDCDRILRVESTSGILVPVVWVEFLAAWGCKAEVLTDEELLGEQKKRKK